MISKTRVVLTAAAALAVALGIVRDSNESRQHFSEVGGESCYRTPDDGRTLIAQYPRAGRTALEVMPLCWDAERQRPY